MRLVGSRGRTENKDKCSAAEKIDCIGFVHEADYSSVQGMIRKAGYVCCDCSSKGMQPVDTYYGCSSEKSVHSVERLENFADGGMYSILVEKGP